MKQGKSLSALAQELERIQETKRDFSVPTAKLAMTESGNIAFTNGEAHEFTLNNWSAGQVAGYTDIPKQYFDRIRSENPGLLSINVNHGFKKLAGQGEGRLVRTLDGHVRGFLSSKYRMLDAHDLLETVLPHLLQFKFEIHSSEITERRLYLKATSPKIAGEVKKGDVVQYGVMVSTSDVGAGSLRIEPFLNRLACLNGMVMATTFKKAHLGRSQFERDVQELLSNETKRLNDKAFFATVNDWLKASMSADMFERELNKMREAAGQAITNMDLDGVVEHTMEAVGVRGEGIKKGILHALASGNEGAGLTRWGLANSFTRAAQADDLDYDTATDLERAGGMVLELPKASWKRIAETA